MKWLLIFLLNRQKKIWENELEIARIEYDMCCNLTDNDIKKDLLIKDTRPEYIALINKLEELL